MARFDPFETFDLEPFIRQVTREITKAQDGALKGVLKMAYEAGYEHGEDDALQLERGVGPQYPEGVEPRSFEKFFRELLERLRAAEQGDDHE